MKVLLINKKQTQSQKWRSQPARNLEKVSSNTQLLRLTRNTTSLRRSQHHQTQ